MDGLELKIPPDFVAVILGILMWLVSRVTPSFGLLGAGRNFVVASLLIAGWALIVVARTSFSREGTTFSPMSPESAASLVTTGVYRFTRNPMYLGTLLVLLSFGVWLSNILAIVLCAGFVWYMDRFQIAPEERALRSRFGPAFEAYTAAVRRWV